MQKSFRVAGRPRLARSNIQHIGAATSRCAARCRMPLQPRLPPLLANHLFCGHQLCQGNRVVAACSGKQLGSSRLHR